MRASDAWVGVQVDGEIERLATLTRFRRQDAQTFEKVCHDRIVRLDSDILEEERPQKTVCRLASVGNSVKRLSALQM